MFSSLFFASLIASSASFSIGIIIVAGLSESSVLLPLFSLLPSSSLFLLLVSSLFSASALLLLLDSLFELLFASLDLPTLLITCVSKPSAIVAVLVAASVELVLSFIVIVCSYVLSL